MKTLTLLALCAGLAAAQTATFPATVVTDRQLTVSKNRVQTTLAQPMGTTDTVITLTGTTGVVANMVLTIDSEIVQVISLSPTTVTRAFDSTAAAVHATGSIVSNYVTAWPVNALDAEVKAIETSLGANLANVSSGALLSSSFNFAAQTPGGSLIIGNNSVTLTPVPRGVNGTDTSHYLYVSAGSGTPEACLITGGAGTSGQASGVFILQCANTHTGAWTIASATAGIQEAIQTAQTAGGGSVAAGGGSALTINANIAITGTGVALHLSGLGLDLAGGSSIVMAGLYNEVTGENTPVQATTTSGDIVRLTGCGYCTIAGLYVGRTNAGRPAVLGAGVNIASGTNTNLHVLSLSSQYNYQGIWAQVAPVVSTWSEIEVEHSVTQGIQFDADNDEHFNNVAIETSGGHALQIGKGSATTNCVGGFRIANLVTFNNGGDGVHIEGAAAFPCVFTFIDNAHADTDGGYELYAKNAGAIYTSSSLFNNGKGGWLGDGVTGVFMAGTTFNGSSQEGLYITNGATRINGSSISIVDSSQGNAGVSPQLRINNSATKVNITGLSIGAPDLTSAAGILVEVGTGAPSAIHLNSTQMFNIGNMTTPVTIPSGLTDVYTDYPFWTTLALANGWTSSSTPQFRLETNANIVRVTGTIAAGTLTDGTTIFTLPVGARPAAAVSIPVVKLDGGALPIGNTTINIATSGVASIYGAASAAFLRLQALTFSLN